MTLSFSIDSADEEQFLQSYLNERAGEPVLTSGSFNNMRRDMVYHYDRTTVIITSALPEPGVRYVGKC